MSDNEYPAVAATSIQKLLTKPYKHVNEKLFIDNKNDPDHLIRNLYLETEQRSIKALAHRRQIEMLEAEVERMKAEVAMQKAENNLFCAESAKLGREMWMRIGQLPEFDDRLRWKFDRKEMQKFNDESQPKLFETLVLVRTIDEDDERELMMKRFSQMMAEHMGIEDKVMAGLKGAVKSASAGHYL